MEREYDLFEIVKGEQLWRGCVVGLEAANVRLKELAAATSNEVCIMYLPHQALIAKANVKEEAASK
jgi:hypothetical protein